MIRDLAVEPLDVAMASGHRLATRTSLRAADLADASWIGVPPGFPFDTVLTDISATLGTAPQIVQRVRDNRLVEALVRSSEHLALLPRFTTPHRSGLRLLPLEDVPAHRYLTALMRPDRAERRAVRTVLDALIDVATAEAAADEDAGLGEGERALRP